MKVHYVLEEGLAIPCETGAGLETVESLQNAVKYLNEFACDHHEIEVYYFQGVTADNYHSSTPLSSDAKLPSDTSPDNAIVVHVPNPQKVTGGRRQSITMIPSTNPRTVAPRRQSLPLEVKSKKTDLPDYLKRKCYVKYGHQTIQVLMDPDEPCLHLKQQLAEATGVPTEEQRFAYNGINKPFEDAKTLRFYGCQGGGFFNLYRQPVPVNHQTRRGTFVAQATPTEMQRLQERRLEVAREKEAEQARRAEEEEAKRLAEEEWAARVLAAQQRAAEEARLAREAAEAERLAREAAEAERLAQEAAEAEKLAREAAEAERLEREAAAKKRAEEEAERLAKEDARRKAEEEWAARKLEQKRKAEEERLVREAAKAERLAAKEAERLAQEVEAKRLAEAEAVARKKAEEEWAARILAEQQKAEEEARIREEEEAKKRAEEEWAARVLEAQQKAKEEEEEEATKKRATEEAAQALWNRNKALAEVDGPGPNGALDGPGLARGPEKHRAPKKEKARRRASKPKMREEEKKSDDGPVGWQVEPIKCEYVPTPMDMSTQRVWYQLEGDFVPYYLRFNGWEKTEDLKKHILATRRSGRNAALLERIQDDLSEMKLFPADVNENEGKELGPSETLPSGTTQENPILVIVGESNGMGRELTPISGRKKEQIVF